MSFVDKGTMMGWASFAPVPEVTALEDALRKPLGDDHIDHSKAHDANLNRLKHLGTRFHKVTFFGVTFFWIIGIMHFEPEDQR